jgi:glutamate synthase (NADPH) large chain
MTGGMAFIYDGDSTFQHQMNGETVIRQRVETSHWEGVLKALIQEHVAETQSAWAQSILADWDRELPKFWQVVPKEMLSRLEHPVSAGVVSAAE